MCCVRSVYAGKTSTPRSGTRIQGRRNVATTPVVATPKNQASADDLPLSPVIGPSESAPPPPPQPDKKHDPLQRTGSWQSSASGTSSKSGGGGGTSRTGGPVPKPRFVVGGQAIGDEVDLVPVSYTHLTLPTILRV